MYKKIIIILFTLAIAVSCQKSGFGYVKGTVVEKGSGIPVEGIIVYLLDTKHGSTHYNQTASAISDANGNYYIKYYKNPTHRYFLKCEKDDNYNGFGVKEITYKKSAITIDLEPNAYIKIRVRKNSVSQNYINIRVNGTNGLGYIYNQNPYDTILPTITRVQGNTENTIEWFIYDPATLTHTYNFEKVYIAKNDVLTYLIQFN